MIHFNKIRLVILNSLTVNLQSCFTACGLICVDIFIKNTADYTYSLRRTIANIIISKISPKSYSNFALKI